MRMVIIPAACLVASIAGAQDTKCPIDSTATWAIVNRTWSREAGATWSNDSLRRVLLALQQQDQEPRRDFGRRANDTTYLKRLIELDRQTSAAMKEILDRFGLPTRSMVGAKGTDAVFLVVQHSATLQERLLDLAKRARLGEVPPSSLAMLERFYTDDLAPADGIKIDSRGARPVAYHPQSTGASPETSGTGPGQDAATWARFFTQ